MLRATLTAWASRRMRSGGGTACTTAPLAVSGGPLRGAPALQNACKCVFVCVRLFVFVGWGCGREAAGRRLSAGGDGGCSGSEDESDSSAASAGAVARARLRGGAGTSDHAASRAPPSDAELFAACGGRRLGMRARAEQGGKLLRAEVLAERAAAAGVGAVGRPRSDSTASVASRTRAATATAASSGRVTAALDEGRAARTEEAAAEAARAERRARKLHRRQSRLAVAQAGGAATID